MSEKREFPGGIPRRIYRLPRREVDRMIEEVKGGFDGDGKGYITFFHPINPSPRLLNEETLTVQLKLGITYRDRSVYLHGKSLKKRGVKATHTYPIANLERMEIVPEGLLLVPHGSPYESNPDLLIVPDDDASITDLREGEE